MRIGAVFVVALLLPLTCAAVGRGGPAGPMPETLPAAFGAAWARHDADALGRLMADDGDFVNVGANWFHGRRDFTLYHRRLLEGRFADSLIVPLEVRTRMMRPDVAIVHWSWRMTGDRDPDGTLRPPRTGLMSMIVERRHGVWQIVSAQNTNRGPGSAPEKTGIVQTIVLPEH